MKFRGELMDTLLLTHVLTAFSHVGDACCVHLTPTQLRLVCNPEHSQTDGVYAFFQCSVSSVLESCKVESRAAGNDILFLVSIGGMLKAVKSCESFDSRIMKLSKKDGRAYLSFDMHTAAVGDAYQPSQLSASAASASAASSLLSLTQDVPILVLPASALPSTAEPDLSLPTIRLQFPPLRPFHTAVDRLRSVSPSLSLRLSNAGSMVVSSSDDISSMQTHWKGLALEAGGGGEEQCTVRVSGRKLSEALHCKALSLLTAICCVVENECLILYGKVRERRGTITYFIPLLSD